MVLAVCTYELSTYERALLPLDRRIRDRVAHHHQHHIMMAQQLPEGVSD